MPDRLTLPSTRHVALTAIVDAVAASAQLLVLNPERIWIDTTAPERDGRHEAIWPAEVTGEVTTEVMPAWPAQTYESLTMPLIAAAATPGQNHREALDRIDELWTAIRHALQASRPTDDDRITLIELTSCDGPHTWPTENGYIGGLTANVSIDTLDTPPALL